jgi:hypothetical protein
MNHVKSSHYIDYTPSEKGGALYFNFEKDFVKQNVRCIPMIVRFKLDACGVKLKLAEWSQFKVEERKKLADQSCITMEEIQAYKKYVNHLIVMRTGHQATELSVEKNPAWADADHVQPALQDKAKEFGWEISIAQWRALSQLQRFALLKLCKPGHENKNFPKAMREFELD